MAPDAVLEHYIRSFSGSPGAAEDMHEQYRGRSVGDTEGLWKSRRWLAFAEGPEAEYMADVTVRQRASRQAVLRTTTVVVIAGVLAAILFNYADAPVGFKITAWLTWMPPWIVSIVVTHLRGKWQCRWDVESAIVTVMSMVSLGSISTLNGLWCFDVGEWLNVRPCRELADGNIDWQGLAYFTICIYVLAFNVRVGWRNVAAWVLCVGSFHFVTYGRHLSVGSFTVFIPYCAVAVSLPTLSAYNAELADREQWITRMLVRRRYAEVLQLRERSELERQKRTEVEIAREAVRRTLGYAMHELRNPLHACNAVIERWVAAEKERQEAGSSDSAAAGADEPFIQLDREEQRVIVGSVSAMRVLCDDVLDHGKLLAGKLEVQRRATDLRVMLQNIVDVYSLGSDVDLLLRLSADKPDRTDWSFNIDEHRVRQILANGLTNSIKATSAGVIVVHCAVLRVSPPRSPHRVTPGPVLQFSVWDSGVGLSSVKGNLFEDYTQTSDIKLSSKGTGLGLPFARLLVQLMGGDISLQDGLEPEEELGDLSEYLAQARKTTLTRFRFTVPTSGPVVTPTGLQPRILEEEDSDADASATKLYVGGSAGEDAAWKSASVAGLHVLLVDDERLNLRVAQKFCDSLGVTHESLSDGAGVVDLLCSRMGNGDVAGGAGAASSEGIRAITLADKPFDAVLMDVVMVHTNGCDVVRDMRRQGLDVPCFAATGNATEDDQVVYERAGFTALAPKPFGKRVLEDLLQRYVVWSRKMSDGGMHPHKLRSPSGTTDHAV